MVDDVEADATMSAGMECLVEKLLIVEAAICKLDIPLIIPNGDMIIFGKIC